MNKIKHVIEINPNSGCRWCYLCEKQITIEDGFNTDVGRVINHYIQKHNYKLLNISSVTFDSVNDCGFAHGVKAFVGSEEMGPEEILPEDVHIEFVNFEDINKKDTDDGLAFEVNLPID